MIIGIDWAKGKDRTVLLICEKVVDNSVGKLEVKMTIIISCPECGETLVPGNDGHLKCEYQGCAREGETFMCRIELINEGGAPLKALVKFEED